jgi:hypothetical protein
VARRARIVWLALAMLGGTVASSPARAAGSGGSPPGRPSPCPSESERRRGWDLRGLPPPCTPRVEPRVEPSVPTSLFSPPWNGLALKWGMVVSLGSEGRYGIGIEPGLSYYGRAIELGVSLRIQALWSEEWTLLQTGSPRNYRDVLFVPRVNVSGGIDHEGFWRMHASAGFGPTWLRARDGGLGAPNGDRTAWSYAGSAGFSAGPFYLALEVLGYMAAVETGRYFIDASNVTLATRDVPGWMLSVGVMVPIALSGRERPPPAAVSEAPSLSGHCRRRGQKINALPLCNER